jgi:hypothetical protein
MEYQLKKQSKEICFAKNSTQIGTGITKFWDNELEKVNTMQQLRKSISLMMTL